MSCSCHPESLEARFTAALRHLAESGEGLKIKQELILRDALNLPLPHEVEEKDMNLDAQLPDEEMSLADELGAAALVLAFLIGIAVGAGLEYARMHLKIERHPLGGRTITQIDPGSCTQSDGGMGPGFVQTKCTYESKVVDAGRSSWVRR